MMRRLLLVLAVTFIASEADAATRIKDITAIQGVRAN